MTLAEKIVARAAGLDSVRPGEVVTCRVDLALMHDSGGPRRVAPLLRRLGVGPWDPGRVVVVTDHFLPAEDEVSRDILALTRRWSAAEGITRFYDGEGICHVVLAERGHALPGLLIVGGDSHSPTAGAFGAYAFGVGATEMAGVLATGEIWLQVPQTLRIEWHGRFGALVGAKDAMLFLLGRLGMNGAGGDAVEFCGEAVAALPMQERMTLANMTAELGGQTGLVAPDAVTAAWLAERGVAAGDLAGWRSDPDAPVARHLVFDAGSLAPQVAAPHSPANARPVSEEAGRPVDVAYIGACTGAKLEDLRMAARLLRGRRIAPEVELLVAPASRRDQEAASAEGLLQVLLDAGARLLPNACGLCAGYGNHLLRREQVCISTTARNFKGRMGDPGAQVYLASPYSVAAAAVAGRIVDPRSLGAAA